jgi:Protein of unknown function (DUF3572)
MKQRSNMLKEAAEALAIQALTFIAGDHERLGRFLAETGIGPAEIRAAAREPGFLIGVLEFLAGDETMLAGFAAEAGFDPTDIGKALAVLGGKQWEREVP